MIQEVVSKDNVLDTLQPRSRMIFRPFIETPLSKVKVVFIGNHPHNKYNFNDGLAFSSSPPNRTMSELPAATLNLIQEAVNDVGIKPPKTGCLSPWAKQGVLLWNSVPTNILGKPFHHYNTGWESLTEEVIETVYLHNPRAVFVWFEPTHNKRSFEELPSDAHKIRMPGPYMTTAYNGFFSSKIFSRVNTLLKLSRQREINWALD